MFKPCYMGVAANIFLLVVAGGGLLRLVVVSGGHDHAAARHGMGSGLGGLAHQGSSTVAQTLVPTANSNPPAFSAAAQGNVLSWRILLI